MLFGAGVTDDNIDGFSAGCRRGRSGGGAARSFRHNGTVRAVRFWNGLRGQV